MISAVSQSQQNVDVKANVYKQIREQKWISPESRRLLCHLLGPKKKSWCFVIMITFCS